MTMIKRTTQNNIAKDVYKQVDITTTLDLR